MKLNYKLKKTIQIIRQTSLALGEEKKVVLGSEKYNRIKLKKSLVSIVSIKKGERFDKNMLAIKRPGTGLVPKKIYTISNYVAANHIKANSVIKLKMIKKIKK